MTIVLAQPPLGALLKAHPDEPPEGIGFIGEVVDNVANPDGLTGMPWRSTTSRRPLRDATWFFETGAHGGQLSLCSWRHRVDEAIKVFE